MPWPSALRATCFQLNLSIAPTASPTAWLAMEPAAPAAAYATKLVMLADIAVASPFVNLEHAGFDFAKWPKAKAYADAILARPSFADIIKRERRMLGA